MVSQWLRAALKAPIGLAASAASFDRPIFILAPPRSGSTFLFECLCQIEGVFHLPAEADLCWWRIWPYDRTAEPSDFIGEADLGQGDLDELARTLYRQAVIHRAKRRRRLIDPGHLLGLRKIRYLDKTIANCFHLEVLERAFPDAHYVFLVRDPRASIASMIEGWPHLERFGKPQLTPIVDRIERRGVDHWTYPAPPGWQAVVDRPLAEICAWIWQRHVEAVLDHFEQRRKPLLRLTYEELVGDAPATVRKLAQSLHLPWTEAAARYAARAPLSRTTVSRPADDKWRAGDCVAIEGVLPIVQASARRSGYDLTSIS